MSLTEEVHMADFTEKFFNYLKKGLDPGDQIEFVRFFLEWRGFLVHQRGAHVYLDQRAAPGFNPDRMEEMGDGAALKNHGLEVEEPNQEGECEIHWSDNVRQCLLSLFVSPGAQGMTFHPDQTYEEGRCRVPALALDPSIALLVETLAFFDINTRCSCSGHWQRMRDPQIEFFSRQHLERFAILLNICRHPSEFRWVCDGNKTARLQNYRQPGATAWELWEYFRNLALQIREAYERRTNQPMSPLRYSYGGVVLSRTDHISQDLSEFCRRIRAFRHLQLEDDPLYDRSSALRGLLRKCRPPYELCRVIPRRNEENLLLRKLTAVYVIVRPPQKKTYARAIVESERDAVSSLLAEP